MRISDWSSDVCSSDLDRAKGCLPWDYRARLPLIPKPSYSNKFRLLQVRVDHGNALTGVFACLDGSSARRRRTLFVNNVSPVPPTDRSEEHTSELQSLMRISYAVFCLKKKTKTKKLNTKASLNSQRK